MKAIITVKLENLNNTKFMYIIRVNGKKVAEAHTYFIVNSFVSTIEATLGAAGVEFETRITR